eukprot:CAMPEP_0204315506 /NCGR_PEP_ID=MMETSP0469-20131031/4881_1 /ASSEMBLY_ACC=CAM_ASM_000384 /TAXON_ID=2969 /ORGANISM="Oxyrrhis marina" /LENGTH=152 /DNA_ID=CAMNT_0051296183 /DNA_START=144 /DNA_END=602 /DNA_ORIENTATION=-
MAASSKRRSCDDRGTSAPHEAATDHGTPSPRQMLQICEPMHDAAAIEPYPRDATVIALMASGISAPRATMQSPTNPIAEGCPRRTTHRFVTTVTTSDQTPIHAKATTKVTGYQPSIGCMILQSGHVASMGTVTGTISALPQVITRRLTFDEK